tara:strand:+ start:806 stop:1399 length:594 start_codon:yes stop_codon:yes gene_type:complete
MLNHSSQIMLILSSPSGAGKTTLTKKIQQKYKNFRISVSHTTRKARPNEVNGVDYHFVSKQEFNNMLKNNEFYEHAEIFDNYYGTSKKSVVNLLKNKNDILFDIDWQGTQQLAKYKELNLTKIFILPPSKLELKKRLFERNQDKPDSVEKRLLGYEKDSLHWNEYDFIILNDKLEICYNQIEAIILQKKRGNHNYLS